LFDTLVDRAGLAGRSDVDVNVFVEVFLSKRFYVFGEGCTEHGGVEIIPVV
jgi:hypothetical protein